MVKKGDVVKIRKEWQDSGDDAITFIAVDNEEKGRVTIEAQLGFRFNPQQVVTVDMLDL
jgi:hypothetical protein